MSNRCVHITGYYGASLQLIFNYLDELDDPFDLSEYTAKINFYPVGSQVPVISKFMEHSGAGELSVFYTVSEVKDLPSFGRYEVLFTSVSEPEIVFPVHAESFRISNVQNTDPIQVSGTFTLSQSEEKITVTSSRLLGSVSLALKLRLAIETLSQSFGILPNFISKVIGDEPDPTGAAADVSKGMYVTGDGLARLVEWDGAAWNQILTPFPTIDGAKVDSVADLRGRVGSKDGQTVQLLGYYGPGTPGGDSVYWDAAATDDDNGGTVFKPTAIDAADPGRWRRPDNGFTVVTDFGATGDGVTDDGPACNAAHVAAHASNRWVIYPRGTYFCTESLRLFNRNNYTGSTGGVIIQNTDSDKPVMASDIWLNGGFTGGRCHVKGFTLQGASNATATATENHGLVLLDYYSTLEDIRVEGVAGNGIRVTDTYRDGSRYTVGSLIDNRIENCHVFGAVEYSFFLGEESSPPIVTDGHFINCKARATRSITRHVYIGVATGWYIDGIHLFGTETPTEAMRINNAHYTRLSNIYIENYSTFAIVLTKLQKGTEINGGNIKMGAAAENSRAIYAEKSSAVADVDLSLSDINFDQPNATPVKAVETNTTLINVWTKNLSFGGSNKDSITKYTSPASGATNIRRLEDVVLDHPLRMGLNNKTLQYRGNNLGLNEVRAFSAQSVNSQFTVNLHNFRVCNIPVYINAFQNMWQAKRVSYQGMVSIGRKADAVDINDFAIDLTHAVHTAGEFNTSPAVTLDSVDIPNNTATFTISFESANADADGCVSIYPSIN